MENCDEKAKVLASKYLFKKPWLTVRQEKIELPNGVIVPEYYILEYPDWVNTLAITKDKKICDDSPVSPWLANHQL